MGRGRSGQVGTAHRPLELSSVCNVPRVVCHCPAAPACARPGRQAPTRRAPAARRAAPPTAGRHQRRPRGPGWSAACLAGGGRVEGGGWCCAQHLPRPPPPQSCSCSRPRCCLEDNAPLNRTGSWGMIATWRRSASSATVPVSRPSMPMVPPVTGIRRKRVSMRLDLPLPVRPTTPQLTPPCLEGAHGVGRRQQEG